MRKKRLQENTFFILLNLIKYFLVSLGQSFGLFIRNLVGKEAKPLQENRFLDMMNFFFHIGPKSFWKAPSGVKIGRSIGTFLHYIFKKEQYFSPKKK
ncbi:hypothetical protein AUK10_00265 [Candidatus Gracilibacteria bacterium CG2_30_37_12]|nr:MAG: hypothetical protein AUK10_00265 [Candidatus Gracilibacteria bacterium CG2_30_37_12]